jgi:cell division protein FtsI (penicillin-binding protein 3)
MNGDASVTSANAPLRPRDSMPWHRRFVQAMLYGRNVDRSKKAKARLGLAMLVFSVVYLIIGGRLVLYALTPENPVAQRRVSGDAVATSRPDIIDRNGEILATDVMTPSLFAEPRRIIDADEASELLTAVMPDLDHSDLRDRLGSRRGFVWLKREISATQQEEVHRLGVPGLGFLTENKRVYPNGREVSHVLGHVNVDNQGTAGIERWLDSTGLADLHRAGFASDRNQKPVQLSIDLRVQHVMHEELAWALAKFKAQAAAGIVMDVRTGEVVSMVSLPDYDSNNPREANDPTRLNRLTTGIYEMGSTFKAMTLAMGLDSGKMTLDTRFDARMPLRFGKFNIHDYHAQNRVLSIPEIFTYSSNIGAARVALKVGVEEHKAFLRKLGQLDRLKTELPESREPMVPKRWGELNTVTISFGHGLSVEPLQAVMGIAALVNGGLLIPPTFLKRSEEEARAVAKRVIKPETSVQMRYLMRLNAEKGSATKADIKGYYVGGKTGTAEKVVNGRYSKTKLLTDFMAVLPADEPKYLVMVMLDEPQGLPETHGYATAAWNSGVAAAKVITRIAPLLRLTPRFDLPTADKQILGPLASARPTR